jgi:choline transport protein
MDTENYLTEKCDHPTVSGDGITAEAPINASGHRQELEQNFSLFSICGIAVTTGELWIVLGNSIVRMPGL